jgi:hypothetical protein
MPWVRPWKEASSEDILIKIDLWNKDRMKERY